MTDQLMQYLSTLISSGDELNIELLTIISMSVWGMLSGLSIFLLIARHVPSWQSDESSMSGYVGYWLFFLFATVNFGVRVSMVLDGTFGDFIARGA